MGRNIRSWKKIVESLFASKTFNVDGFIYKETIEEEPDNTKIFHDAKAPNDRWVALDRSPYNMMSRDEWVQYVNFFKENGRWPTKSEGERLEGNSYE